MKNKLIAVVGTTASGKSSLGISLAKVFGGEIISADSRQIYKYLNLGTGKVTQQEMRQIRHHLIDILDLNQPFSLSQYQKLAYASIDDIVSRAKVPFLVGGTGLYARAIIEGYNLTDVQPDFDLRNELEQKSIEELIEISKGYGIKIENEALSKRHYIRLIEKVKQGISGEKSSEPKYEVLTLGMTYPREELYQRIEVRLDQRIADGMIEEVKNVLRQGATEEFLYNLGLEYRYTAKYIKGEYASFEKYREELLKGIRHFAKRQMTWFKKEKDIVWLNTHTENCNQAANLVSDFLNK